MKLAVSPDIVRAIKAELRRALPEAKSSHLTEAIARGLGWATHAALRTSIAAGTAVRAVQPSAFEGYLSEHGLPVNGRLLVDAALRGSIRAVMAAHPELTHHGFGVYDEQRIGHEERQRKYAEGRDEMLEDRALEEFERACEFLALLEVSQVPMRVLDSYNLKHSAERWHHHQGIEGRWEREYVSNGMLLAAAWHLGLQVRRASRTACTGFLNVSTRSVRALDGQRKPPLPQPKEGELFRVLGHLDGRIFYLVAGRRSVIPLRAAAHTPANLLRLAPFEHWTSRFPSYGRRATFDTVAAVNDLFMRAFEVGLFEPDRFRRLR